MALAYVLKIKAQDEGFTITNYGEYLENHPPECEADIKEPSSWSCFHGVGRWCDDCGCSTGGHPGWNQKWRKPLREALDYLRDEFIELFEEKGKKYFADPWEARNNYIDVMLDRSVKAVRKFQNDNLLPKLSDAQKVKAIELLEIQRQAMLMYTSCGWFFSELSGIEPVQILKYAARAMQLASRITDKDFEVKFLEILSDARSNIHEQGNGREIFERYVRPSVVSLEQVACLWAVSSLYRDTEEKEDVYSYTIKKNSYKKVKKGKSLFVIGNIEVQSKVTTRKEDLTFALVQFSGGDFHCAIKNYSTDFKKIRTELMDKFMMDAQTEIIRALDGYFGSEYFTLKDIFIEERQKIIETLLKGKLHKFAANYQDMYDDGKGSIYHLRKLGLKIPEEFKISARYALSRNFNDIVSAPLDEESIVHAAEIIYEARMIDIALDKQQSNSSFSQKLLRRINKFADNFDMNHAQKTLDLFDKIEKLELEIDIAEAQNLYFNRVYHRVGDILDGCDKKEIRFVQMILKIGERLNINTDFYRQKLDKVLVCA
jgi:alpha-amylase/alpha-mannosidase (GH57 family)